MRTFLSTTAVVLAMGTTAYANPFAETEIDASTKLYASDLIGKRVYTTEAEVSVDSIDQATADTDWNDIGEIDELILSRNGDVQSVIIGVGGFLGIGEKDVALDMSQIKFISDGEDADEFFLVVNASVADVEGAPAYERDLTEEQATMTKDHDDATMKAKAEMDSEAADAKVDIETAMDEAANDAEKAVDETVETAEATAEELERDAETMAANASEEIDEATDRTMAAAPQIEREGYTNIVRDELNTEDLTGARVYSVNDEDIGEVSELLVTDNGQIDRAIIDVGGFLGLGEHSVEMKMDELSIVQSDDGGYFRVYVDVSQEKLEAMPEYQG